MLKKVVITTAGLVLIGAIGISAFNAFASPGQPAAAELPNAVQVEQPLTVSDVAAEVNPASGSQVDPGADLATVTQIAAEANAALPANQSNNSTAQAAAPVFPTAYQAGAQAGTAANAARQSQGGNQGGGRGNRWQNTIENANGGQAEPDPQNGFTGWETYSGFISQYSAPNFILNTAAGQSISAQLGNINYVTNLGLQLADGDWVTVSGYWETSDSLAVGQITLADGSSFTLRDEVGRPLWGGGPQH